MAARPYRAGQSVEDHCRSCHEDRIHTVVVVDAEQQPLRVTCDFCGSEHNFRGGGRTVVPPMPLVSERELAEPHMSDPSQSVTLEALLETRGNVSHATDGAELALRQVLQWQTTDINGSPVSR